MKIDEKQLSSVIHLLSLKTFFNHKEHNDKHKGHKCKNIDIENLCAL
jgi:hypothetical protein